MTELPPATARRCLQTLEDLGYVGRAGRRFFLRALVMELSAAYLESINGESLGREHLQPVVAATGYSSSLAVLDGREAAYLVHVCSGGSVRLPASQASRFPAESSAIGRVLLAGLSDEEFAGYLANAARDVGPHHPRIDFAALPQTIDAVRQKGYAFFQDELSIGVASIAVPVYSRAGGVIAAVNCSANDASVGEDVLIQALPVLRATAQRIGSGIMRFPALRAVAESTGPTVVQLD
jgi:IclR family pca regulon transcriptional regulator